MVYIILLFPLFFIRIYSAAKLSRHITAPPMTPQCIYFLNLAVFLIMTGLFENISELQDSKTLTFLYRTPKIELKPLNLLLVSKKYAEIFDLPENESMEMAKCTRGYPFAFQVLGYLCWSRKCSWKQVLTEYDVYLEEYVYEKIWSELSAKDQEVLRAVASSPDGKVESIRNTAGLSSQLFNVYRKRLLKRGLISAPAFGRVELVLPRFQEFVSRTVSGY